MPPLGAVVRCQRKHSMAEAAPQPDSLAGSYRLLASLRHFCSFTWHLLLAAPAARLDMSAPLTHGQRELIQLLRRSCDNLLDLINEILDFSKVESGVATLEERSFDLRHLISGVT